MALDADGNGPGSPYIAFVWPFLVIPAVSVVEKRWWKRWGDLLSRSVSPVFIAVVWLHQAESKTTPNKQLATKYGCDHHAIMQHLRGNLYGEKLERNGSDFRQCQGNWTLLNSFSSWAAWWHICQRFWLVFGWVSMGPWPRRTDVGWCSSSSCRCPFWRLFFCTSPEGFDQWTHETNSYPWLLHLGSVKIKTEEPGSPRSSVALGETGWKG